MKFTCPLCLFHGEFMPVRMRPHAQCPSCKSLERHRLQYVIVEKLLAKMAESTRILHFAPEEAIRTKLQSQFEFYDTADLVRKDVTYQVDLCNLPFEDNSYDVIYASHVLEHISDDILAITEIYRVLNTNGVAILPVPIVADKTIEYSEPNPEEDGHVRAPGLDYFERFAVFSKVEVVDSSAIDEIYQPYVFTLKNSEELVQPSPEKVKDYLPLCFK